MSNTGLERCGEDALRLVADYWVLRIVQELHLAGGPVRFTELQRLLDDVSPVTLTARLRSLDDRALVARTEGATGRASVSYELTDRGRALLPVIQAISDFASVSD